MRDRVTLECTAAGWEWVVWEGGAIVGRRTVRLDRFGASGETLDGLAAPLASRELLREGIEDGNPLLICRALIFQGTHPSA